MLSGVDAGDGGDGRAQTTAPALSCTLRNEFTKAVIFWLFLCF
jgi:hypothetical protein